MSIPTENDLAQQALAAAAIQVITSLGAAVRENCARIVDELADQEDEGETCTALRNAAAAIRNGGPT